jgi:hypothetical protein
VYKIAKEIIYLKHKLIKIRIFSYCSALAFAAITTTASAQNYTTAVGARLGL